VSPAAATARQGFDVLAACGTPLIAVRNGRGLRTGCDTVLYDKRPADPWREEAAATSLLVQWGDRQPGITSAGQPLRTQRVPPTPVVTGTPPAGRNGAVSVNPIPSPHFSAGIASASQIYRVSQESTPFFSKCMRSLLDHTLIKKGNKERQDANRKSDAKLI